MISTAPMQSELKRKSHLGIPPLQNGDSLHTREFLRRYDVMPNLKKAELIENIVYMSYPVDVPNHAEPDSFFHFILHSYVMRHPESKAFSNGTWVIDSDNTVQPDCILRLKEGASWIGENGYLQGAPELVAEISASTVSLDNHKRKRVYQRAGVREYLVWRVLDREIDFWRYDDESQEFHAAPLDADGIWTSAVFPGLALDVEAVLRMDHAAAVAKLS